MKNFSFFKSPKKKKSSSSYFKSIRSGIRIAKKLQENINLNKKNT
jgi:hypothetical protein